MDILDQVLQGREFSANELAKLYEYDIFTLGQASKCFARRKIWQKGVFQYESPYQPHQYLRRCV